MNKEQEDAGGNGSQHKAIAHRMNNYLTHATSKRRRQDLNLQPSGKPQMHPQLCYVPIL